MIGNLVTRINKLRVYLGQPEFLPNEWGLTKFEDAGEKAELLEIQEGIGHLHTWDVSFHNGDPFNQQSKTLSHQELVRALESIESALRIRAERKVKHELEENAIKKRMLELGLA